MKISNLVVSLQFSALTIGFFAFCQPAQATDYVWTGSSVGAPTNWLLATNWKATATDISANKSVAGLNLMSESATVAEKVSGVPGAGDTATLAAGANVIIDQPVTLAALTIENNSTLQGAGNVTVTTTLNLRDAQLTGEGKITLGEGATTNLSGQMGNESSGNTLDKVIDNRGTINWASGKLYLKKNFYNRGKFNIDSDSALQSIGLTKPTFINEGTITKDGDNETVFTVSFNNSGDVYLRSGNLDVGPRYVQSAGSLNLDGGSVSSDGTLKIQGGRLAGSGTIKCDVVNNALFKPGHSPGIMTINGNYTQTTNGILDMEIGGLTAGSGHDQLNVWGVATLDGTLSIVKYGSYMPTNGDNFILLNFWDLNTSFRTYTGLYPGNSLFYRITNLGTQFVAEACLDTNVPTVVITSPVTNRVYQGVSAAQGIVHDEFNGSERSGVKSVNVRLFRHNFGSTTSGYWLGGSATNWSATASLANELPVTLVPNSQNWSFAFPVLPTGKYRVHATAKDNVGNIFKSPDIIFDVNPSGTGYAYLPMERKKPARVATATSSRKSRLMN